MKDSTPSKLKVAFSTTKPLPVLLLDSRLLGGSWVVISGVVRPLIWVIAIVGLLITPLITSHEPPSSHTTTC